MQRLDVNGRSQGRGFRCNQVATVVAERLNDQEIVTSESKAKANISVVARHLLIAEHLGTTSAKNASNSARLQPEIGYLEAPQDASIVRHGKRAHTDPVLSNLFYQCVS